MKRFARFVPRRLRSLAKYFGLWLTLPLARKSLSSFQDKRPEAAFRFINNNPYWGDFFAPMQIESEFLGLLQAVAELKPKTILEIGTAKGGTLFCLTKMAEPNALIMSIDLPRGRFGGGYGYLQKILYQSFASAKQKLLLWRDDSHRPEVLAKVKEVLNGQSIDLLFIDGDHSYEGVKKDFAMYAPLVRSGGLIAFHDIAPGPKDSAGEVSLFWQEIKNNYSHQEFVKDWNQGGLGLGLIKKV